MQRWQLTTGLAGAVALAALLVPTLRGKTAPAPTPPATPQVAPPQTAPVPTAAEGALSLTASLDQATLLQHSTDDRYLVIEVSAPDLPGDVRRPVQVALVVDVSGSMAGRNKISHARDAAEALAGQLRPEDAMALVTFSDRARTEFSLLAPSGKDAMIRRIRQVSPGGGTNLYDGVSQGIAALESGDPSAVRRVIVLSDGMANIGVTDAGSLAGLSASRVDQGIAVSALGVGLDFNEDLLASMSDAGGGAYKFVDEPERMASYFTEELHQMTRVAGREVALDVDLGPGVRIEEVYGYDVQLGTHRDGYELFMGDVHGGETRKIVARVSVDTPSLAQLDIADVQLRYTDTESGTQAAAMAEVDATVTTRVAEARASVDKRIGATAARAAAAKLMDESARAWDAGDRKANQQKLAEGNALLKEMATYYEAPELDAEAEAYDQLADQFGSMASGSDESLFQVKKVKEKARATSR